MTDTDPTIADAGDVSADARQPAVFEVPAPAGAPGGGVRRGMPSAAATR